MSYSKQTWDTNSYVNPTRMNHIEDGIENALPKDSGGTVKGNVTIDKQTGSTTSIGQSELILGNNIAEGTAKNSKGILRIYGKGAYKGNIGATNLTADRNFELPDKSGTIALKDRTNYTYTLASGFEDVASNTHWLYERNGDIHLHCNIYHSTGYTAGVYTYPITLPVGARPSASVYAACTFLAYAVTAGNERGVSGFVRINSNGAVTAMPIQSMTGIADVLIIDIVFPVD